MFKSLKQFFVPSESNKYQPHSLKNSSISTILIIVLLLEFFAIAFLISPEFRSRIGNLGAVLPAVLIAKVNNERAEQQLVELVENPVLTHAALIKAQDMASRGYFAHVDPDGNQPWHYLKLAGYKYQSAGENLAVNFVDSSEVHRAWMKSPTHKANIVQPKFTEIGIATAEGVYKGKNVTFVVQFFGVPQADTMMAAVQKEVSSINKGGENVLGAFTEKIYASPRTTISYILYAIAGLILISIILKVFVAPKVQYKNLIFNGFLILIITLCAIFINYLAAQYYGEIASIDESQTALISNK